MRHTYPATIDMTTDTAITRHALEQFIERFSLVELEDAEMYSNYGLTTPYWAAIPGQLDLFPEDYKEAEELLRALLTKKGHIEYFRKTSGNNPEYILDMNIKVAYNVKDNTIVSVIRTNPGEY